MYSALCLSGFIAVSSHASANSKDYPAMGVGPVVLSAQQQKNIPSISRVNVESWGQTTQGEIVHLITLRDELGHMMKISTFGATVQYLTSPDKNGKLDNIVLGYKNLKGYIDGQSPHFGATVGRVANRIAGGTYGLEGKIYHLQQNDGPNTLHSGSVLGFSNKVWTIKSKGYDANNSWVVLTYTDPASIGFPGNLSVDVKFNLDKQGQITLDYTAKSDADTIINLTNHTYWNLQGEGSGNIERESLLVNADKFTPTNSQSIPTGKISSVKGTVFDYRQPVQIASRIHSADLQMLYAHGLDQNFVLNGKSGTNPRFAARLIDPTTRRILEVFTTEPGIQAYTSNGLDGSMIGTSGKTYRQTDAIALEAEHFPDSIHHKNFPSIFLHAGDTFHSQTIWKLGVAK